MAKKLKKAFTITELVIVIAVVAILAAVLIPTFANIINKAEESADTQTVTNINQILSAEEIINGKPETMHEAISVVEDGGYKLENLTPTRDGYDIVWDEEYNRLALLNENGKTVYSAGEVTKDKWKLWKIVDDIPENYAEEGYSYYASPDFSQKAVTVVAGFDAGNVSGITSITYDRYAAAADPQDVIFRTNGGKLVINAESDTVTHYGAADCVDITSVAGDSYHEYGVSLLMRIADGHLNAKENSKIYTLVVSKNDSDDLVTVTKAESAKIAAYKKEQAVDKQVDRVLVNGEMVEIGDNDTMLTYNFGNTVIGAIVAENGEAEVGGIQYSSLKNAYKYAFDGETVKLLKDVYLTNILQIMKETTIDLNGYAIYSRIKEGGNGINNSEVKNSAMILVSSDEGALTVTDSSAQKTGRIDIGEGNPGYAIAVHGNTKAASLTICGGTIVGNIHSVYVGFGNVRVTGGRFNIYTSDTDQIVCLNCANEEYKAGRAKISITGGSFYKYDPSNSVSESPAANFVADGYRVTQEDENGYFSVVKA